MKWPKCSARLSFRDRDTLLHPIARVEHDTIAFRKPGQDFRHPIVSMSDLYNGRARPPVFDGEDRPILFLSEQRADRQGQY